MKSVRNIVVCNTNIRGSGPLTRIHGSVKSDSTAMQQIWHIWHSLPPSSLGVQRKIFSVFHFKITLQAFDTQELSIDWPLMNEKSELQEFELSIVLRRVQLGRNRNFDCFRYCALLNSRNLKLDLKYSQSQFRLLDLWFLILKFYSVILNLTHITSYSDYKSAKL